MHGLPLLHAGLPVPGAPRTNGRAPGPGSGSATFCYHRPRPGKQTACAEACPTGATKFGNRDELLLEAWRRIDAEPGKYMRRVYGLERRGGTSVLYLSPVPFEQIGLRRPPEPVAHARSLTMARADKVPNVVTVGGVLLAGIWWITNRREEVSRHEDQDPRTGSIR